VRSSVVPRLRAPTKHSAGPWFCAPRQSSTTSFAFSPTQSATQVDIKSKNTEAAAVSALSSSFPFGRNQPFAEPRGR
jgi:hypothetical protein